MRINFKSIARLAEKALAKQGSPSPAEDAAIADKIREKLNVSAFSAGGSVKKTATKKRASKKC